MPDSADQHVVEKGRTARPFARFELVAAGGVFLLALILRLIYLHQIQGIGFFEQPVSDGLIYDQRAQGIAAGDWLGPADFVHAPLYAYLLGIVQTIVGHDLYATRVVQVVLGSLACVILLFACRRFFDRRVAIVAALLLAIFPPAIFFDGLIQKTGLALLLSTILLYLLARAKERLWWGWWLAAGGVLGLLGLTRQNALALALLLVAWLWVCGHGLARRRAGWLIACLAGLIAALGPWVIRNKVITGELVLTTPNLGQNFAMGNHPNATGTYLPFKRGRSTAEFEQQDWVKAAEKAMDRPLSPKEVSQYYLSAAWDFISAHPGQWLLLMGKKLLMVWDAYEAPDTEDYYLYQEWSPLLWGLDRMLHFGVLCPLAAAGLVLTWKRWRDLWVLYGWLIITTLAVGAFVVFARYRFPLVPVLAMFAAAAIVEATAIVRAGRGRRLAVPLIALIVSAVVVNWPVYHERRTYPISYTNHGAALAVQGRYEEDLGEIAKALALSPDNVDAHLAAGNTLVQLGRGEEAIAHYERARADDPAYGGVYRGLGNALFSLGRLADAGRQYRAALEIDSADHLALDGLGRIAAAQGRLSEAAELLSQAITLDPTRPETHLNLGNTYLMAGRLDEAALAYEQALSRRAAYPDALYNLGLVEVRRRRPQRAIECFRRVLQLDPKHVDARIALASLVTSSHPSHGDR